jgi:hypothetical protein
MLFDKAFFSVSKKLLSFRLFKFIPNFVESFWRFYKRQIFNIKIPLSGGKTELEIVLV